MSEVKVRVCYEDKALDVEEVKELIGFQSEKESGIEFGEKYDAKLPYYGKVRWTKNKVNRPFKIGTALKYAKEWLRGKWQANGQTIVFDESDNLHTGQHRIIGYLLAVAMKKENKEEWLEYGRNLPKFETIIVTGISKRPEVADTIDLGPSRSLADVIYRDKVFKKGETAALSRALGVACRLTWLRSGGDMVAAAKHFPHSEALDFLKEHPDLAKSVMFISNLDQSEITPYITVGYAASLHYLMATCKTKQEAYDAGEGVDLSMKDKADAFWEEFAKGESKLGKLKTALNNISASGAMGRDEKCGTVIKAWELWLKGKPIEAKEIKVAKKTDRDTGKKYLDEEPRLGGIDIHREPPPKPVKEEKVKETKATGKKGGKKAPKPKQVLRASKAGKKWAVGDKAWVDQTKDGVDPWFGEITSFSEDGKVVYLQSDEGEFEASLDELVMSKPKAAASEAA